MTDPFGARARLVVDGTAHEIHRLDVLAQRWDVGRLPYSLRVLLENVLRAGSEEDVEAVAGWSPEDTAREVSFSPARFCCTTPPASPRSSTWRRCATQCTTSAAIRRS
jgi:aconitate hydratase